MATITLQLGNYSNYVASHMWNLHDSVLSEDVSDQMEVEDYATSHLYKCVEKDGVEVRKPRSVILDLRENMVGLDTESGSDNNAGGLSQSVWGGVMTTVELPDYSYVKPDWNDTSVASGSVQYWSDFLRPHLHPKSVCEMPLWTKKTNFDTYFAGNSDELVPPDVIEDLLDRIRYFAEECDNLQCVRVFADLHDGFAGVACSTVEALRDEYSAVAVPVWAFTEPYKTTDESQNIPLAPSISSALRNLGVPLSYSKLSELASAIIPIGDCNVTENLSKYIRTDGSDIYQTSAAIALAIETVEGYRHLIPLDDSGDRSIGPQEWCHTVTKAGRFPFCNLEAALYPSGSEGSFDPLLATFQEKEVSAQSSFSSLNPFLQPLSACYSGSWAVPSHVRTTRAYSNILSVRGPIKLELTEILYSKCLMTSYMITNCSQRQTPLLLCRSFPRIFTGLSIEGTSNNPTQAFRSNTKHPVLTETETTDVERCSFIASVGCDSSIGQHVGIIAQSWKERPHSCRAQLDKVGLGSDECKEILEGLLNIKYRYEPSTDF